MMMMMMMTHLKLIPMKKMMMKNMEPLWKGEKTTLVKENTLFKTLIRRISVKSEIPASLF